MNAARALAERLRALRAQSGTSAEAPARAPAHHPRRQRPGPPTTPTRIDDETLAARLGGRAVRPGVVRVRERLGAGIRHGASPLSGRGLGEALALAAGFACGPPSRCVFMDTETTGLAGGTGTLVFVLGMARFVDGVLVVDQLFLTGFEAETAMLAEAQSVLADAETLVTFNGRSFDAPLLATRFRLRGVADPFARLRHVDLLHASRRLFAGRWPDCRLESVERRLLGVRRAGDLPGREAPQAWFDWLRHGDDAGLAAVGRHNRLDLLTLAALPAALEASHSNPHAAGADPLACARARQRAFGAGEAECFAYLAAHRVRLDARGLLELARLARRRRDWPLAVGIWEELAACGQTTAIEHLAKYHEHQRGDYRRASELTRALLERAPNEQRHRRRADRLSARLREPCRTD